jgi:hypothetical protein
MRMAFGLVSLLVTMAIIMWLMSMQVGPGGTVPQAVVARQQVAQIAGRTPDGTSVRETIAMTPVMKGSRLEALLVSDLLLGGAMQAHFGLAKGDEIVAIETRGSDRPTPVREVTYPVDPELAEAYVLEAFQFRKRLVVLRNGTEMTMPPPGFPIAPTALTGPPPITTVTTPPNSADKAVSTVEDRMKALQQVR